MGSNDISVVVPCHGHEHFLFRLLSSVVWQLEDGDNVIIVHDSAEKLSPEIAAPFGGKVLVIENGAVKGVSYSRNRAIETSNAHWIKFLDADDVLSPFALTAVRGGDIPETTQVLAGACDRMKDGCYFGYCFPTEKEWAEIMEANPTVPSLTFVRRAAVLEVGLFNEQIDYEEDWDLWLRIHRRYGPKAFQVVEQSFCYYWIAHEERIKKKRAATINGKPVREYFREQYGANPREGDD